MKIQKSTFLIAGFISLGMFACNSDSGTQSSMSQSSSAGTYAAPAVTAPATPASGVNTQSSGTVVHPPTKLGKLMNLGGPANFSASGSGLNPAHGMPGHNCDVAVGAPLPKGPVATSSAPVASAAPIKPAVSSTPNFNANLKNINPAHGEPGHDCAVAVGAPLPAKGGTTPAAVTPAASTPNFGLPAKVGKLNPAHGEPGHDCGIAVGAPLPG